MAPPVSGYVAWWDASQITGVTDGSLLSAWNDLTANGNNFAASGTTRPTYYTSTAGKTVNGLPAVWFVGGSSTVMTNSTLNVAQPDTIFTVGQCTSISGFPALLQGTTLRQDAPSIGPNWSIYAGSTLIGTQGNDINLHRFTCLYNGASSLIRVDGVTAGTGNPGSNGIENPRLGTNSAVYYWTGPVCEIIIYPSALSSTDYQSVENYLYNKWFVAPAAPPPPPSRVISQAVNRAANFWRKPKTGLWVPGREPLALARV